MNATDPMVILYIKEMDRALGFYRDVIGLRVEAESPHWSTLSCEGLTLALHSWSQGMDESMTPHAGLNLRVDDLDAAIQEVEAGGGEVLGVREARPGIPVRLALVRDTEGNGFELRQHVDG